MPLFTAVLLDRPDTLSRRVLSAAPIVLVGRLSYSIYLFHLLALKLQVSSSSALHGPLGQSSAVSS